jgi:hypothetical protein
MFSTATSKGPWPDGPETKIHLAVANLIQQHPLLSGTLATFLHYSGDLQDDADPDNLPRPFVRLNSRPGTGTWFAAGQHQFTMKFMLELGVDGTDIRPMMNLWSAIRTALSPTKPAPGDGTKTVLNVMMAAGLVTWKFDEAAYEIVNPGKGANRYLYGLGEMSGSMLVNT